MEKIQKYGGKTLAKKRKKGYYITTINAWACVPRDGEKEKNYYVIECIGK
jgi:hypothetical protein